MLLDNHGTEIHACTHACTHAPAAAHADADRLMEPQEEHGPLPAAATSAEDVAAPPAVVPPVHEVEGQSATVTPLHSVVGNPTWKSHARHGRRHTFHAAAARRPNGGAPAARRGRPWVEAAATVGAAASVGAVGDGLVAAAPPPPTEAGAAAGARGAERVVHGGLSFPGEVGGIVETRAGVGVRDGNAACTRGRTRAAARSCCFAEYSPKEVQERVRHPFRRLRT